MSTEMPGDLSITLPASMLRAAPDALSELIYGVAHAQEAFAHIQEFLSQSISSDPGLISLLELAGRGLKQICEHEGELVAQLERVLRKAVSQSITEEITSKGKGCNS